MTALRILAATASVLAISACGTHKSVAPVAQGTDAGSTSRVYNAPQDQTAANARLNALYQAPPPPPARPQPSAEVEPVRLKPVSAVYLSDDERARVQQANYQAAETASYGGANGRVVTVAKGDTVYALGRRYNVAPKAIIAENNLRAPYHLEIGQKIRLPGVAAATQTQGSTSQPVTRDVRYRVKPGDTLYAISRKTGVSVARLAQANGLRPPYALSPGQEVLAPGAQLEAKTTTRVLTTTPAPVLQRREETQLAAATVPEPEPQPDVADLAQQVSFTRPDDPNALFVWPVRGAVISEYGVGELGKRNDGINIAAPAGTPVRASADGEVVYRGSELEGFGNLLLVKHADGFVTAYAHNDAMLVKKGDVVRKGQVIAKVGQTGNVTTPQLHFEIRQKLKSVDPLSLLQNQ